MNRDFQDRRIAERRERVSRALEEWEACGRRAQRRAADRERELSEFFNSALSQWWAARGNLLNASG